MTNRDEKGRFVKGSTGNPGGRPTSGVSFTDLLRAKVEAKPKAVERLVDLMESEDENVALKAIVYFLNRLEGMPKQATEISGPDDGPIEVQWRL